jgi:hypothetical protein
MNESIKIIDLITEWYQKQWISLNEYTRLMNIYF